MGKSKKILFFDNWTKGYFHFLPIEREMKKRGVECLLIHRGSWGNDTGRQLEERIDGILTRDIRYYGTDLIYKMLQAEKPDVVMILTFNYMVDRAVILAARALGIKTCFLMHGVDAVGEVRARLVEETAKHLASIRLQRALKYVTRTIPNYFYSGIKADPCFLFSLAPYQLVWDTFTRPAQTIFSPIPSTEMQADRILVYANVYKEDYCRSFGFSRDSVHVVGAPYADDVFAIARSPGTSAGRDRFLRSIGLKEGESFCVYLEDAFVESGIEGWTNEGRIDHLREIADAARMAGMPLVIKLHPGTLDPSIESKLSDLAGVNVIRKTDLERLLHYAECGIGHISSAIDRLICLRKPILSPQWGRSSNITLRYVDMGVAHGCRTPTEMTQALNALDRIQCAKKAAIEKYFDDYITYFDGKSRERIVQSLDELLMGYTK